jgi:hypothetical protein
MTMPGFTAEASLYTRKERYRAFFPTSIADGEKILPQYCYHPVPHSSLICCWEDGFFWCSVPTPPHI